MTIPKTEPVDEDTLLAEMIEGAVNDFVHMHPKRNGKPVTAQQVNEFETKLAASIRASLNRKDALYDIIDAAAEKRQDEIDQVLAEADMSKVHFRHLRHETEELMLIAERQTGPKTSEQVYQKRMVTSPTGGATFAISFGFYGDSNTPFCKIAVATCSDEDQYDKLEGMKGSLKRFKAGETIEVNLDSNGYGKGKLKEIARNYRKLFHNRNK